MTANAGYKTFNTGDVLTAAQVQYNLQNQSVMYFATTTARDAALTGSILVDGMVSYTPATGLMVYNGTTWAAPSASIPTSYGFTAGKNAIINGDFGIWQRGTSFSSPAAATYTSDRWQINYDGTGATQTISQQTFTPGTAPVSGYEGTYFWRWAVSLNGISNTFRGLQQKIEDVRQFAGQTVSISFWAKADSARTLGSVQLTQDFGSGGSAPVYPTTTLSTTSLTTSWQRITGTIAVPSISGKTIGTNSSLIVYIGAPTNVASTFDIWGVQLEAGSTATSFQTATGTKQGELAACQRYYYRTSTNGAYSWVSGIGLAYSTTSADVPIPFPVTMRTTPTAIDYANIWLTDDVATFSTGTFTNGTGYNNTQGVVRYVHGTAALTQYRPYFLQISTSGGYLGFTAEL
jgi:hypothetical protein